MNYEYTMEDIMYDTGCYLDTPDYTVGEGTNPISPKQLSDGHIEAIQLHVKSICGLAPTYEDIIWAKTYLTWLVNRRCNSDCEFLMTLEEFLLMVTKKFGFVSSSAFSLSNLNLTRHDKSDHFTVENCFIGIDELIPIHEKAKRAKSKMRFPGRLKPTSKSVFDDMRFLVDGSVKTLDDMPKYVRDIKALGEVTVDKSFVMDKKQMEYVGKLKKYIDVRVDADKFA